MTDNGLWAFLGFLGSLLLLGIFANVALLLDIKIELSKASKRRLPRRGDDATREH